MPKYLLRFAQKHEQFRIPELESLSKTYGTKLSYSVLEDDNTGSNNQEEEAIRRASSLVPSEQLFIIWATTESEEKMRLIASRSVTLMGAYQVFGRGETLDEALADFNVRRSPAEQEQLFAGKTFHFKIDACGIRYPREAKMAMIDRTEVVLTTLWTTAKVRMHKPDFCFYIIENIKAPQGHRFCVARKVSSGARKIIETFSLKKRTYLGITSMDPELSILMATQGLVKKGSLTYDPFVGTGSLSLVSSYFGALSFGSDISYTTLYGTVEGKSVIANYKQLGIEDKLLGLALMDQANSPIRQIPFFDAIICDPPYGVRAGARKVGGKKSGETNETHTKCVPYPVPDMLRDLLASAARLLVLGGRLVFWMPSTLEYKESDLPRHPCLRMVSNSLQQLNLRWGRRLITMEKCAEYVPEAHTDLTAEDLGQLNPSHARFGDYALRSKDQNFECADSAMDPSLLELLQKKAKAKAERDAKHEKAKEYLRTMKKE